MNMFGFDETRLRSALTDHCPVAWMPWHDATADELKDGVYLLRLPQNWTYALERMFKIEGIYWAAIESGWVAPITQAQQEASTGTMSELAMVGLYRPTGASAASISPWDTAALAALGAKNMPRHYSPEVVARRAAAQAKKARLIAQRGPKFTRGHVCKAQVIQRDGLACHLCGIDVDPRNWHLEHVIPLALGGTDCLDNAAVAHPSCNLAKSDSWAGSLNTDRFDAALVAYRKAHKKSYRGPIRSLEAV